MEERSTRWMNDRDLEEEWKSALNDYRKGKSVCVKKLRHLI